MSVNITYTTTGDAANVTAEDIKKAVFKESPALAKRMSESYANHLKTTLVRVRALATGKTVQSVRAEQILSSPSRSLVMSRVTASRSIIFIQGGRRPGAKAPARVAGYTATGKKIWEPLPALIEWFVALNIPKVAWLPIVWAIKRRGIKPREVQKRAINASQKSFLNAIEQFGINLAKNLFKPNP